jgi:hypothetical protein
VSDLRDGRLQPRRVQQLQFDQLRDRLLLRIDLLSALGLGVWDRGRLLRRVRR